MRIDGCSFTIEALRDTLQGLRGYRRTVSEGGKPATVEVSFPGIRGIPEGMDELKTRIEMILPLPPAGGILLRVHPVAGVGVAAGELAGDRGPGPYTGVELEKYE
jgi:hypothetical protein